MLESPSSDHRRWQDVRPPTALCHARLFVQSLLSFSFLFFVSACAQTPQSAAGRATREAASLLGLYGLVWLHSPANPSGRLAGCLITPAPLPCSRFWRKLHFCPVHAKWLQPTLGPFGSPSSLSASIVTKRPAPRSSRATWRHCRLGESTAAELGIPRGLSKITSTPLLWTYWLAPLPKPCSFMHFLVITRSLLSSSLETFRHSLYSKFHFSWEFQLFRTLPSTQVGNILGTSVDQE